MTIGIIYARFARPNSRACTILFSRQAVIRRVRDKFYFFVQVCELRKHQILQARVRFYALRHETNPVTRTSSHTLLPMAATHPKIGEGAVVLFLPQIIAHEIDDNSPLFSSTGNYFPRPLLHFALFLLSAFLSLFLLLSRLSHA